MHPIGFLRNFRLLKTNRLLKTVLKAKTKTKTKSTPKSNKSKPHTTSKISRPSFPASHNLVAMTTTAGSKSASPLKAAQTQLTTKTSSPFSLTGANNLLSSTRKVAQPYGTLPKSKSAKKVSHTPA